MSGPQFFETRMGAKFFEHTLPNLVEAIKEATAAMHRLAEAMDREAEALGLDELLELPCVECQENEAIVALPWDREKKVCAECWAEITDGSPIADADRIQRIPPTHMPTEGAPTDGMG